MSRNSKEKQEWLHERDVKSVVQGPAIVSDYFTTCHVKRVAWFVGNFVKIAYYLIGYRLLKLYLVCMVVRAYSRKILYEDVLNNVTA